MSDANTRPETEESIMEGLATFQPIAPLNEELMMTTGIVVAYVSNNHVALSDLPSLIRLTYNALKIVGECVRCESTAEAAPLVPAVWVKRSITPDYIVCLEDGKKFKSLKRHLRTRYDMTPEQYRTKWNLASDYPMVAPNYAAARSELAKNMGLGQQRRASRPIADRIQAAA